MKHAKLVVAPATPESLFSLLSLGAPDISGITEVILQSIVGNAANVNFGNSAAQPGFLLTGTTITLTVDSLKNTFIKGNGADFVAILVTH